MEDEIDIYADLPNFNLGDNENLTEKNKKISEKCTRLEKQVADLTQSLESLQKVNNNLEVNLSSLLKTAKAEIARKDRMIADIRRQLDNMQFRRGEYSKSVRQTRRSPPRRKQEEGFKERNDVVEAPEVPDTTEFLCNPPPSIKSNDNGIKKSHKFNGVINTVFGERLRKRILEEQEEERRQKEESKAKAEAESKKTAESMKPERAIETSSKTDPGLLDPKPNSIVRSQNKGSSLGSSSNLDSQEDADLSKRGHPNRKRQSEDQPESVNSHKKSKSNNGKSRSYHNDEEAHGSNKNSSKRETQEELCAEISASDDLSKYQIVDEYEAPIENEVQNKRESVNKADDDDETQDRHNRVAIRLMLLAEGIDPDVEAKKSVQNEQKKVVDDKKYNSNRSRETVRSRSKSRNRRHDYRSRSRTPEEHWKNRKGSRQREDKHRRSRDRFEKRRDLKNKDGDNLSEFSREICDLKERIEHRVDDRSSDRGGKGRNLNRYKRNDERSYKSGRSRTPDSSRSGSKEKTEYRSRDDKKYGRSRSRERYKSRNRGTRDSNFDNGSTKSSRIVESGRKRTEDGETAPTQVLSQVAENPETKSLLSLEDGEIVDSASSSPMKVADPLQHSTEKLLPSSCKLNLLESDESVSKIADVKCSLPLREIGNSQNNEKSVVIEKPVLATPESNQLTGLNDSLNTSKDERIENIAEFIANFSSDVLESKRDEKSNDKMMPDVGDVLQASAVDSEEKPQKEKIRFILNTVFQGSSEDPLVSPLTETTDAACTKNVNGNSRDDDWCLIAIDSPIKNFEENRKNRMIAQNLQLTENVEPSKIVQPLQQADDCSETTGIDNSQEKVDSEVEKVVSDKTTKPLSQPIKNTAKTKPAVLTSLRSTYHRGRKEIVLSDTNSEQCTKISMTHPVNSTPKSLGHESETLQHRGDDINKPVESTNIGSFKSKSPVPKDVDSDCNNAQKANKKHSMNDLFGDQEDSGDIDDQKESTTDDRLDVVCTNNADIVTVDKCVDETTKQNGKPAVNDIKTEKEVATKIGASVKEFKGKQTTACKTDVLSNSKTDATKGKSMENGIKTAKSVPKVKVEGSNSKQKKEPQKLVVIARRRKPVHLEDSSTSSSSVVVNQNSFDDSANNSSKSINDDTEPSDSLDTNREASTEHGGNEVQRIIANDSANVDKSEFSNVKEKRTV